MKQKALYIITLIMLAASACIKPFESPKSAQDLGFLVVDGTINIGAPTTVRLTRTKNISDDHFNTPELNASVFIESESGQVYNFQGDSAGYYSSGGYPVSFNDKYRLKIETKSGEQVASDFVEAKQSPPIDSVNWVQNNEVYIYVNTHDPSNNTRYYRWVYEETSQYQSHYDSYADFIDGQIVYLTDEQMRYNCYKYYNSTDIILGSSTALSDDVIKSRLINIVPNDNSKISVRYSILVKQFALTQEAYNYWQMLKQNSEQTGNVFDPQPSQLVGNIHSITDPGRPVLGYVSASSVSEQRLFIRWQDLEDRRDPQAGMRCDEKFISFEQAAEYLTDREKYRIAYFTQGAIVIARMLCVDCTLRGGTNVKPTYW